MQISLSLKLKIGFGVEFRSLCLSVSPSLSLLLSLSLPLSFISQTSHQADLLCAAFDHQVNLFCSNGDVMASNMADIAAILKIKFLPLLLNDLSVIAVQNQFNKATQLIYHV